MSIIAAPNRRSFLAGLGAVAATAAAPTSVLAGRFNHRLRMVNPHTGERFDETIVHGGAFTRSGLRAFARFARDWRQNEVLDIDPRTITTVIHLQRMIGNDRPMVLLSGYRSPKTNAALKGAVRKSLHIRGMAMDIHQPGVRTDVLHRAAVSLRRGGVGKYSRSSFVHVDCGNVRHWGS